MPFEKKTYHKEYMQKYRQSEKFKKYRQSKKFKAAKKKWYLKNRTKILVKAQQPEVRKKKLEYMARWHKKNKAKQKQYYLNNQDRIKKYRIDNRDRTKKYMNEYVKKNRAYLLEQKRAYFRRPEIKNRTKDYLSKPEVKLRRFNYNRIYKNKNREKINTNARRTNKIRHRRKMSTDPIYQLRTYIRSRFRAFLLKKSIKKDHPTFKLVGCSLEKLKLHIEKKFKPGMSWKNHTHNTWHIDHIKPLSLAKNMDDVVRLKLMHYTNLQPLWAKDNILKSNRVIPQNN